MVRRSPVIKWEKALQCRPVHNITSSDFANYVPQPWKFMEGKATMNFLMSYEYQRMWKKELRNWKESLYPKSAVHKDDIVKRYVLTFKNRQQRPKSEKIKPFKMKRFQGVGSKTSSLRPSDKAMKQENNKI